MKKNIITFIFSSCLILITSQVNADETFTMDQITGSVQSEYQSQLNRKPRPVRKKKTRTSRRAKTPTAWAALLQETKVPRKPTQHTRPAVQKRAAVHQRPVYVPPKHKTNVKKPVVPHQDSLFNAASSGNVQWIEKLLQQGLNVNVANPERETALHMAAAKGHFSAAIYLINHGANIHARTINNWLPIHHASRFRHARIANYLYKRGSSPHALTSDGVSAIDMAKAVKDQRLMGLFGVR